jgi:cyclophilin family peptidyl-prolyl cis-trans isomerase
MLSLTMLAPSPTLSSLGYGGTGYTIDAEFNNRSHHTGAVNMARANDPNSADSQFSIMYVS